MTTRKKNNRRRLRKKQRVLSKVRSSKSERMRVHSSLNERMLSPDRNQPRRGKKGTRIGRNGSRTRPDTLVIGPDVAAMLGGW